MFRSRIFISTTFTLSDGAARRRGRRLHDLLHRQQHNCNCREICFQSVPPKLTCGSLATAIFVVLAAPVWRSPMVSSMAALHRWIGMVDQTVHEHAAALSAAVHANRSRRLIICAKDSGHYRHAARVFDQRQIHRPCSFHCSQGLYHLESCRSYRRTQRPDRWFCSEDQAQADGFRKAFSC
jgi:hypothetical protein